MRSVEPTLLCHVRMCIVWFTVNVYFRVWGTWKLPHYTKIINSCGFSDLGEVFSNFSPLCNWGRILHCCFFSTNMSVGTVEDVMIYISLFLGQGCPVHFVAQFFRLTVQSKRQGMYDDCSSWVWIWGFQSESSVLLQSFVGRWVLSWPILNYFRGVFSHSIYSSLFDWWFGLFHFLSCRHGFTLLSLCSFPD